MALWAWALRRVNETPQIAPGDITKLTLPDAPVGDRERDQFTIVIDWKDEALEARLLADPTPIGDPYMVTETKPVGDVSEGEVVIGEPDGEGNVEVLVRRSAIYIDGLTDEEEILLDNADIKVHPVPASREGLNYSRVGTIAPHLKLQAPDLSFRLKPKD